MQEITIKHLSKHRILRYELVEEPKKPNTKANRIFMDKKLAIKVIMNCRKTSHKFRTRLRFKQYDVMLRKEPSVLTRTMSSLEGENM